MIAKLLSVIICIFLYHTPLDAAIEIKPIRPDQIEEAKALFFNVVYELQLIPCTGMQEVYDFFERTHQSKDYDDLDIYFKNRGTFLVVTENQKVIGTGAIKFFDDECCELKRFYFAKEFRGRGLGGLLLQQLISHARAFSYKKMRLEVYFPSIQTAAVHFYKKSGFYPIPPYRDSKAQLSMEMKL